MYIYIYRKICRAALTGQVPDLQIWGEHVPLPDIACGNRVIVLPGGNEIEVREGLVLVCLHTYTHTHTHIRTHTHTYDIAFDFVATNGVTGWQRNRSS